MPVSAEEKAKANLQANSRRTLEEITERVEAAIAEYEKAEERQPERFSGLRRPTEVDATYGELANAGRARVDVHCVALNEIAAERASLLTDMRNKLEGEKARAEREEKEERRREGREGTNLEDGDGDIMEDTDLIERIDLLEALQHRMGDTATSILQAQKANAAGPMIKALKLENADLSRKLEAAHERIDKLNESVGDKTQLIKIRERELGELRDELRTTKEKLKEAMLKLKESKAMQPQPRASTSAPVGATPPATPSARNSLIAAPLPAAKSERPTADAGCGTSSEPPDEALMFSVDEPPEDGVCDEVIDGMDAVVKALGQQLRDHFAMPDASAGSLEACLFDHIESVRSSHKAALVSAILEAEANAAAYSTEAAAAPDLSERAEEVASSPRPSPRPPRPPPFDEAPPPPPASPPGTPAPPGSPTPSKSVEAFAPAASEEVPEEPLPPPVIQTRPRGGVKFAEPVPAPSAAPEGGGAPSAEGAAGRRQSVAANRRGSLRGGGGLENETERAQRALFDAKQQVAKELEELGRVRAQAEEEREQVKELLALRAQSISDASGASADGDAAAAAMQERLAEMEAKMAAGAAARAASSSPSSGGGGAADAAMAARVQEAEAGRMRAEAETRKAEDAGARELQALRDALGDEHTIALEDAEELREVCVLALGAELKGADERIGWLEGARARLEGAAAAAAEASGSVEAAELTSAREGQAALEERMARMEAAAADAEAELREAQSQLAQAAEQREALEQAVRDASEAVHAAGGGASELMDARQEVSRLRRLNAQAEAQQALADAERDELVSRARAAGRAEGESAVEGAVAERTAELLRRVKGEQAQLQAVRDELAGVEEGRSQAEAFAGEAADAAHAAMEWAQERVALAERNGEARLMAAQAAQEAASDRQAVALQEAADCRQALEETRRALEAKAGRADHLERELAVAQEQVQALTEKLRVGGGGTKPAAPPPIAPTGPAEPPKPAAGGALEPDGGDSSGADASRPASGSGRGAARHPPMSDAEVVSLMERTQRTLHEVASLTAYERQLLLGDPPSTAASAPGGAPPVAISVSVGNGSAGAAGGGGSGSAAARVLGSAGSSRGAAGGPGSVSVLAGSGSRIAWLLREGIGSTGSMAIKGAVKPSSQPMPEAQLRKVLRALFAQQRTLSSQSAVGNWELLGAIVLLHPKQLHLQSVHDGMVSEANSAEASVQRREELAAQLPRVAALSMRREQQRRWCLQVWDLRRQAVGAVQSRLSSQALYALTKLTDVANMAPAASSAPLTPLAASAPSPRAKKREALASALFGAPPLLPFVMPTPGAAAEGPGRRSGARDWAAFSVHNAESAAAADAAGGGGSGGGATGGAAGGWAQSAHDLWGRGHGLTTDQMQRLCVAAQYWPRDFAQLGGRLQRQVLAEAVAYCLSGSVQPGAKGTTPPSAPVHAGDEIPPPRPTVISSARDLGTLVPQPPPPQNRPGTAPANPPFEAEGSWDHVAASRGRGAAYNGRAGQPVVLSERKVADPAPRVLFTR